MPGRRLPLGPWHATISLVSGFTRRTASATVSFSGAAAATRTWLRMAIWITVLLAVLLGVAGFLVRRTGRLRAAVRTPSA